MWRYALYRVPVLVIVCYTHIGQELYISEKEEQMEIIRTCMTHGPFLSPARPVLLCSPLTVEQASNQQPLCCCYALQCLSKGNMPMQVTLHRSHNLHGHITVHRVTVITRNTLAPGLQQRDVGVGSQTGRAARRTSAPRTALHLLVFDFITLLYYLCYVALGSNFLAQRYLFWHLWKSYLSLVNHLLSILLSPSRDVISACCPNGTGVAMFLLVKFIWTNIYLRVRDLYIARGISLLLLLW